MFYKEHILPEGDKGRHLHDHPCDVSRDVVSQVISAESASEQFVDIATFGCDRRLDTARQVTFANASCVLSRNRFCS